MRIKINVVKVSTRSNRLICVVTPIPVNKVGACVHWLVDNCADKLSDRIINIEGDVLCLSTAHPGKFQDAVEKAIGEELVLPDALESLKGLPTRKTLLPPEVEAVRKFIEEA